MQRLLTSYASSGKLLGEIAKTFGAAEDPEKVETYLRIFTEATGYDGIVVENSGGDGNQTLYIAFSPNQIKNMETGCRRRAGIFGIRCGLSLRMSWTGGMGRA